MLAIRLCHRGRPLGHLMLVVVTFLLTAGALADSCYEDAVVRAQSDPEKSVVQLVDVAFEGKVVGKWTETEELLGLEPRTNKVTIAFLVTTVHKGNLPINRTVKVTGGAGFCSCIKDFQIGKSYRVLAVLPTHEFGRELELRHCTFNYEVQ